MIRTTLLGIFAWILVPLWAQDTRTVTEPVIPHSCTVLTARLKTPGDETRTDTARIQSAIDGCAAGQAVELKAGGGNNVFLSGPVQLRAGVTLVVDGGVTLLGSRNPRDYDLTPGSCGIVSQRGHGCKPLIAVNNVSGAGVMGRYDRRPRRRQTPGTGRFLVGPGAGSQSQEPQPELSADHRRDPRG